MSRNDDRVAAVLPAAAALVCAVADHDQDEVAKVLAAVTDWAALAVVLAGHVHEDTPLSGIGRMSPESKALHILHAAAVRFGTTVSVLRSDDRTRAVLDARAVAMAAMRYAGLSSPFIGKQTCRDHSTVLHAAGRVGEDHRLRKIALNLAQLVGGTVAELGDEAA